MKVRIFIALTLLVGCSVDVPKVQLPTGVACQDGRDECQAYFDYDYCASVKLPGYAVDSTCKHVVVPDDSGRCWWVHIYPKECVMRPGATAMCCVDE